MMYLGRERRNLDVLLVYWGQFDGQTSKTSIFDFLNGKESIFAESTARSSIVMRAVEGI